MMDQETNQTLSDFQREDQCRKAIKNVGKAILMRLLVVGLVVFAFTRVELTTWLIGLMLFVVIITLTALPPLIQEWKKQRAILKEILDSEE